MPLYDKDGIKERNPDEIVCMHGSLMRESTDDSIRVSCFISWLRRIADVHNWRLLKLVSELTDLHKHAYGDSAILKTLI